MSERSEFVPVRAAAEAAGVSERTMWRWIRDGRVESMKVGRRLFVRPPALGLRLGEAAEAYGSESETSPPRAEPEPGPWPHTRRDLEERRRALLARRRAAAAEMDRLAAAVRPDPDGLTGVDYIRVERDHPRALEGSGAADRALKAMARARRRRRQ